MPNRVLLQREAPRTTEQQDEWRCADGAVVAVEVPCRTIKRHRENWHATKGQEERTQRTACMCKMCWGDGEASWRPSSLGKHPSLPRLPWLLPRRLHIRTWAPQSSEESTGDVTSEEGNPPSFSAWVQYSFIYSGILFYPLFHLLQSIMNLIFSVNCLITAGICFKIQHRDHSRQ